MVYGNQRLTLLVLFIALVAVLMMQNSVTNQSLNTLSQAAILQQESQKSGDKADQVKPQPLRRIRMRIVRVPAENPRSSKKTTVKKSQAKAPQSKSLLKVASANAIATGKALLANGQTPTLVGQLGLTLYQYLRRIHLIGGKLVVFDRQLNRIVGRMRGGKFHRDMNMRGFAARARDVTEDIPGRTLRAYLRAVSQANGAGAYRFLLVLPVGREAQFIGTLAAILSEEGLKMEALDLIIYRYLLDKGKLTLRILSVSGNGRRYVVNRSALLWND